MQQGHTTGIIRNSIAAETNGQRRHIFFNVTREPQFGRLYVNDAVVTAFGQNTAGAAWTVSFLFDKIISNLTSLSHEPKVVSDTIGLLVALADTKEK